MNNRLQTILETVAEIFEQGARESVSGNPLSFATASGTNKPAGPKAKGRERTRNVPRKAFGRGLNVTGNAGTEYGAVDKTGRPINKIAAYVPYMDETDFVGPLGTQEQRKLPEFEMSKPSGGGEHSHLITVPGLGHINYDHDPAEKVNKIWWVERKGGKRGEGSKLVSLTQQQHPGEHILWGVTSQSGKKLATRWHSNERRRAKRAGRPSVGKDFEPHEGQFDPF